MAVPALIFLAMNLLSFVALRRISASASSRRRSSADIARPDGRARRKYVMLGWELPTFLETSELTT